MVMPGRAVEYREGKGIQSPNWVPLAAAAGTPRAMTSKENVRP